MNVACSNRHGNAVLHICKDIAHVGKNFLSEAGYPVIPPLLQGEEQGVWAGPGGGSPLDSPSAPCCCRQKRHSCHPHMSPPSRGAVCGDWGGARRRGQCAPTFPPAPGGVIIPPLGRVASGHGVAAEVLAPAIAPFQPPEALAHPTQHSGGKDDRAISRIS